MIKATFKLFWGVLVYFTWILIASFDMFTPSFWREMRRDMFEPDPSKTKDIESAFEKYGIPTQGYTVEPTKKSDRLKDGGFIYS